jgi:L-methionine (R)-S-oxide reductase
MMTLNEFLDGIEGDDFREECESICAYLREIDSRYDWVGIYWLKGDKLVLGPWSGRDETEHKIIPISEGICGAAIRENATVIIDDVRKDPRYLACFSETRSEIVVPIRAKNKLIGEIDIDGKEVGAYTDEDRKFLEALADHIGSQWPGKW